MLVTGIANPEPLKRYLNEKVASFDMLKYRDHHIYTIDNIQEMISAFGDINQVNKIILTTEKDAVRLYKFRREIEGLPIYLLPIQHEFLDNRLDAFKQKLSEFVLSYENPIKAI